MAKPLSIARLIMLTAALMALAGCDRPYTPEGQVEAYETCRAGGMIAIRTVSGTTSCMPPPPDVQQRQLEQLSEVSQHGQE